MERIGLYENILARQGLPSWAARFLSGHPSFLGKSELTHYPQVPFLDDGPMGVLEAGPMSKLFLTIALGILVVGGAMGWDPQDLTAQSSDHAALRGAVSSPQEGRMEGVVVNARRRRQLHRVGGERRAGQVQLPRNHLEPGKYALTIRAVGL
jgi:hypothetical protein